MTISYNWLKMYLDFTISPEEVSEILTDTGLEVEGINEVESIKGGLKGVVIGEVKSCVKHPNADKLKLTTVDVGEPELLQIVCGAPNVAAGQKVLVATIGTVLYSGADAFTIKKGKIRGEASFGMICAEDELGLGESHDGIMVLDNDAKIGTPASEYFNLSSDFSIEIGLTPNRTDAMGHYGVARDLRAGMAQRGITAELKLPALDFKVDHEDNVIPVHVENTESCPQYYGITISDVEVTKSPEWLKTKIESIGLKSINNVVDVTNFVLHELGHPLHAFDADKITGKKVLVKNFAQGTKFKTLDEVERELDQADLMIANQESPMCIAGVLGGIDSGVSKKTKNVFLESAWFNPVSIRKTAKRHGLNTDASFRYERGVDPNMSLYAIKRAALLIKEVAGGMISSDIQRAKSEEFLPQKVELSITRLNGLIGNNLEQSKIEEILQLLEINIDTKNGDVWQLSIPSYRVDVTREADVIEEVLRIYGFNNIEMPSRMQISVSAKDNINAGKIQKAISALFTSNGYSEIMNNSLTKLGYYEKFNQSALSSLVHILNPLSKDLGVMRNNLIFGGLEVVAHNINRQTSNIKVFEFGNSYSKISDGNYDEQEQVMLLLSGKSQRESWMKKQENVTFFEVKGAALAALEKLGISGLDEKVTQFEMFEECLQIERGPKVFAQIGLIKQSILQYFKIDQPVFGAIINWNFALKAASKTRVKYTELSKFPSVRRDLALLVNNDVAYNEMRKTAIKAGGKLLKDVNLFDFYMGKNLPEGKKSYALSFRFLDSNQTLVDNKVDALVNKIKEALEKEYKAELR